MSRRRCAAPRAPLLPEVSELQVVRHYTRLSQLNFSIDTHFYPLGSCTMKYNPRACNSRDAAGVPRPPSARAGIDRPGLPACLFELQEMLKDVTGMARRVADADGGRAGRVRRRRDDPRLSRGARRPRAQRDHRAGRGARHQSGHRDDVRLHGAGDSDRCRTATSTSTALQGRGRPADRRHHADQSVHARRVRAPHRGDRARSCTRPAACCTTTAPT